METLQSRFKAICEEYLHAFMRKHEFCDDETGEYSYAYWIGDDVGGIVEISDYFIPFNDIRIDIDKCVPKDVYFKYYDYSIYGDGRANYENYLKGVR